jgi:hypothetical protein
MNATLVRQLGAASIVLTLTSSLALGADCHTVSTAPETSTRNDDRRFPLPNDEATALADGDLAQAYAQAACEQQQLAEQERLPAASEAQGDSAAGSPDSSPGEKAPADIPPAEKPEQIATACNGRASVATVSATYYHGRATDD